jgi:hypothetical protein
VRLIHPHTLHSTLALLSLLASSLQAASRAWTAACERKPQSTEVYRIQKCNETWGAHLKDLCGSDGRGVDGLYGELPFPFKQRSMAAGGNWTMEMSIAKRPLKVSSIMVQGKKSVSKVFNLYIPLMKKILKNDQLPSGWSEDDLCDAMLINLHYAMHERDGTGGGAPGEREDFRGGGGGGRGGGDADDGAGAGGNFGFEPRDGLDGDGGGFGFDGGFAGGWDSYAEQGAEQEAAGEGGGGAGPADGHGDDGDDGEGAEGAQGADGGEGGEGGEDGEGEDEDKDKSVFTQDLFVDKTKFDEYLTTTELRTYESRHQPFFLAFKTFGPRSSHPSPWLVSHPLSVKTVKKGGVSNSSRAQQDAERDTRHAQEGAGPSTPAPRQEQQQQQLEDQLEQATKMMAAGVRACTAYTCIYL